MRKVSNREELRAALGEEHTIIFVDAEWSGTSLRWRRELNAWMHDEGVQAGFAACEVDIEDKRTLTDLLALIPEQYHQVGYGGSGEMVWFHRGRLVPFDGQGRNVTYTSGRVLEGRPINTPRDGMRYLRDAYFGAVAADEKKNNAEES